MRISQTLVNWVPTDTACAFRLEYYLLVLLESYPVGALSIRSIFIHFKTSFTAFKTPSEFNISYILLN